MVITSINTHKYIFNSKNAGRMPIIICSMLGRISERKIGSVMGLRNVCYDPKKKVLTFNVLKEYADRVQKFISKLINNQNSKKKVIRSSRPPENVVSFKKRTYLRPRLSISI
ncbi:MAG: hypothetical protein GX568_08565 [Candidatus Gastranaerophilales bacterium]|nr:hypothetical protein [Candidatus Gastranaerophilales bacterium]